MTRVVETRSVTRGDTGGLWSGSDSPGPSCHRSRGRGQTSGRGHDRHHRRKVRLNDPLSLSRLSRFPPSSELSLASKTRSFPTKPPPLAAPKDGSTPVLSRGRDSERDGVSGQEEPCVRQGQVVRPGLATDLLRLEGRRVPFLVRPRPLEVCDARPAPRPPTGPPTRT